MKGDDAISGPTDLWPSRFDDVRRVAETASTNADVMALARDGAGEGIVVVADHQRAGRGRSGRTWNAPAGASLLCTILLRPPAVRASLVTFAVAVSAAEAIRACTGVTVGVKWPNDLVVEGADGGTRKLAGILAEAEWPAGADAASGPRPGADHERVAVAAGIGINLHWPSDLPDDLADIATSLNHLTDETFTTDDVLRAMLTRLDLWYGLLVDGRTTELLDAWRAWSATLGRRVRVDLGSDEAHGLAVDITAEGHLVLEADDGAQRVLAVGDVVHLRPV